MGYRRTSWLKRPIIYHSLENARLALKTSKSLNIPVVLRTAHGALSYAGASYLKKIYAIAMDECATAPAIAMLDCGNDAAAAVNAIRDGWPGILYTGQPKACQRVRSVAKRHRITYTENRTDALDLDACDEMDSACRSWLLTGVKAF